MFISLHFDSQICLLFFSASPFFTFHQTDSFVGTIIKDHVVWHGKEWNGGQKKRGKKFTCFFSLTVIFAPLFLCVCVFLHEIEPSFIQTLFLNKNVDVDDSITRYYALREEKIYRHWNDSFLLPFTFNRSLLVTIEIKIWINVEMT